MRDIWSHFWKRTQSRGMLFKLRLKVCHLPFVNLTFKHIRIGNELEYVPVKNEVYENVG